MADANIAAFYFINQLAVHWPVLAPIAIFLAQYTVILLALSFVFFWFRGRRQDRIMIICAGFAFIIGSVIGKLLGLLHHNFQPFYALDHVNQLVAHAVDNSFPSDHSILFFSVCTSFFLFRLAGRYLWLLLAFCVALSRVMVGVHYPLDISVGALTGVLSAVLVYFLLPKLAFIHTSLVFYQQLEAKMLSRFNKH